MAELSARQGSNHSMKSEGRNKGAQGEEKNVYVKSYSAKKLSHQRSNIIENENHLSRKENFRTTIQEFIKDFLGNYQHSREAKLFPVSYGRS
jgi:hypothetical protein